MMATEPLVSIIIPTYSRPNLFGKALASAIAQDYGNIEIIVSDDSPDDATRRVLESLPTRGRIVRYRHNVPALGAAQNFADSLPLAEGVYVNYLMDDDILSPDKVSRMVSVAEQHRSVVLVTSCRAQIDEGGRRLGILPGLEVALLQDAIVDGTEVGDVCLSRLLNLIGEPTTALFRASALREPYGSMDGRLYGCNVDMATWLVLASSGQVGFIRDILSETRVHSGQQSNSISMRMKGAADWVHQVGISQSYGFLISDELFEKTARLALAMAEDIAHQVASAVAAATDGRWHAHLTSISSELSSLHNEMVHLAARLGDNVQLVG